MNRQFLFVNRLAIFIIVAVALVLPQRISFAATPKIKITKVSSYGDGYGVVEGTVSGVNPNQYYVAVYIQVNEVWWIKPNTLNPKCKIIKDGSTSGHFSCRITSSSTNCDLYATAITVHLIPKDTDPTLCNPCLEPPENLDKEAFATKYRPYPRNVTFSNRQWNVKTAPKCKFGPDANYFSSSPKNVFLDSHKRLHLRIRKASGKWYTSEVVLKQSLGYGTYVFRTYGQVNTLDANVVLGMFLWDSKMYVENHREIDIELARWGDPDDPNNAQFAVQPCDVCPGCGNCFRFPIDLLNENDFVTFYMIWSPGQVDFSAYKGKYNCTIPSDTPLGSWSSTSNVPEPGKENVRINLWLMNGSAPQNGTSAQVVIDKFLFCPPP